MTPLRQAKAAQAAQERWAELMAAVRQVAQVQAALARIRATMPKSLAGAAYGHWLERQREMAITVAEKLRDEGATVTETSLGTTTVSFSGVRATSTMGLAGALRNWRKQADAKARAQWAKTKGATG